jgi:ketosteroid isomerase-like protein
VSTLEELEKRVRVLEDTEEIKSLHREYLFYISNLEMDKALDCFADDITVEVANYGPRKGREETSKFFRDVIYNNVSRSKDAHFTGQAVIRVDGEKASGHWMFYRLVPAPSPVRWVQGRYDCEYVKEKGRWKFSLLKMRRPWPAFLGEKPE